MVVVDARDTCASCGLRPSELFERLGDLRDQYQVPIHVVTTPVSAPLQAAAEASSIATYLVAGADTVADRVRALCIGFPADLPLLLISSDDHVRRAGIREDANVIDPVVVPRLGPDA